MNVVKPFSRAMLNVSTLKNPSHLLTPGEGRSEAGHGRNVVKAFDVLDEHPIGEKEKLARERGGFHKCDDFVEPGARGVQGVRRWLNVDLKKSQ